MRRSTILYLVASGIVAYLYGFPTNGLSHFDEGQYAFARVWPWIDKFDVDQAFFSPPLYPFLVGLVQHLPITRPDLAGVYISHIACWLSLLFSVKLAVAWWGDAAAFPAFVLLLLSPMRLAFGSIGLTDATFSALLLATLLAATKAFREESWRWTLLTGLLAGATWNCKYNGFITLAIIAGFFFHQRTLSSFVRWLVICLIAAAMIAPWFWAIHTHHPEGLAALQKHQSGYLRGAGAIWENLCHGVSLRSLVPGFSTLLICWGMLAITPLFRRCRLAAVLVAILLAGEESSFNHLLPVLAIVVLPWSLFSTRRSARVPLLVAVLLTAILPGIYTPYLRLWLPAEHLLLLAIAGACAGVMRRLHSIRIHYGAVAMTALLLLAPSVIRLLPSIPGLYRIRISWELQQLSNQLAGARRPMHPADGYWNAAQDLVDRRNPSEVGRLLIYARPPLLYYLAKSPLRIPAQRLPDAPLGSEQLTPGTMVVADVAVRDSVRFADSLRESKLQGALKVVGVFGVTPHPLTVLDDFGSIYPPRWADYFVNLYIVQPNGESKP